MFEIERHVLVPVPPVFGIDLSITNEVVLLWVAALVTFVLLAFACRRRSLLARGLFQNLFEAMVEFVETQIVRENIGPRAQAWSPFLLTLFFFILVNNLMGLVPLPFHMKSMTGSLSVTIGLALTVFLVTVVLNLRSHGLRGFFKKFLPAGLSPWVGIPMIPIEIISWAARPITLAIRLFANMMVGHQALFMFIGFSMASAWYFKTLPFLGAVLMACFELFVCLIQAFVFTMLTGIYIRDAIEAH